MTDSDPNAFPGFATDIAGREVRVVTGRNTQTVNICTTAGVIGTYQARYRLPITSALAQADLPTVETVDALYRWLEDRGATLEVRSAGTSVPRLLPSIPAPRKDDPWVAQAVVAAEQAITHLVKDFLENPYMHRVEHSLHAQLYGLLARQSIFADTYELGTSGRRTQLLHKEWPETIADSDSPRGLFDLAILAPQQLEQATITHFRQGRIDAPIVIEIGLDYGYKHLDQDHKKLLQSDVVAPYLVHFSRISIRDEAETEKLILSPIWPVRSAYVHHSGTGAAAFKQLNDVRISTTS